MIVRTPNLRLSLVSPGDLKTISMARRDPQVARTLFEPGISADLEWDLNPRDWMDRGVARVAIREVDSRATIGGVELRGGCISFFIVPWRWRLGYGFEAVDAACRSFPTLLNYPQVRADVLRAHRPSIRILEKVGFESKGTILLAGSSRGMRVMVGQYVLSTSNDLDTSL
jgi:RimJ/RimL family protein N-acetyltransferase